MPASSKAPQEPSSILNCKRSAADHRPDRLDGQGRVDDSPGKFGAHDRPDDRQPSMSDREAALTKAIEALRAREKLLEERERSAQARAAELASVNEALARSEERYRQVAHASQEAICDYDVATDRLDWYEGKSQPFGHTRGAPYGTFNLQWWTDHIHPEDRPRMIAFVDALLTNTTAEKQWENEYRFRRADGSYAWVHDASQMLRDADGKIVGSLCSIQDLTPQREARLRLEKEVEERRQAEKLARGQTETLVRTLSILAKEPTLDGFLGHVLRAIAEQLRAQGAALWIRDPQTDRPVLRLCYESGVIKCDADSTHPAVLRPPCLRNDPTWQEMVRTGRPVLHEDILTDPKPVPYRDYLLGKGVRALLEVPLLRGDEIIGIISIRSRTPGDYTPQAVELAQALTYQATLAIQLTRLAEGAKETAVLAERNRIAQEIHDGLAQNFTGILMQLEAAEESGVFSRRSRVEMFALRVRELAREGLAEARRSVMALRPAHARQGGLDLALRELSQRTNAPGRLTCAYQRFGDTAPSPDKGHAMLRIAQEAVSNAQRHAQPSNILISLRETTDYWELYVLDDGVGMAQSPEYYAQQGFGLESMRERARAIGGDWRISSRPGEGTCIAVRVMKRTPA